MVALSEFHNEIRAAIERGELEAARQLCGAVLAARPQNLETLLLLAEVDLEGGSAREAIEGFERVLEGDPEGYLASAGLGLAWEMLGDHAAAAHWLSRSLELNPASREVRSERDRLYEEAYPGRSLPRDSTEFLTARSLQGSGFLAEAVQTYRTALLQEPGRLEIKLGLAEGLWSTGHSAEAEGLCLEVLSEAPRAVKAKALLACVAAARGDVVGGEALLEEVRVQDPGGRIAGQMISQTPLAPLAIEGVEIDVAQLGEGASEGMRAEAPRWAEWMRRALWQVLRVVLPRERDDDSAIELEMATGTEAGVRSAESRIARALGDDGQATVDLSEQPSEAVAERASTLERALVSEEVFRVPISEATGSGQQTAGEAEGDAAAGRGDEAREVSVIPTPSIGEVRDPTPLPSPPPQGGRGQALHPPPERGEGEDADTGAMNRAATEGVASSERAVEIEAALPAAGAGERAEAEKPRPPAVERTLVIVKPDGVQRGLVGAILGRLEGRGLKLRGLKFMSVSRKLAEQHYAVHRGKPFYEGLVKYISSGPVVAAVFEGKDAVGVVRATVGATDPAAASPGTIRGDWAVEIGRNLMHASDSRETGEAEIALWFPPKDLVRWRRVTERWISEMGG